ncbi:PIH1 family [Entophlyctis helioformis]|nr:PIH1 family [Entophlyctis helioformis]
MSLNELLSVRRADGLDGGRDAADGVYAQDPGLEGLVQEFAERMAQQAQQAQQAQKQPFVLPGQQTQAHGQAQARASDYVQVTPQPGFVVKTKTTEQAGDYPAGMKVFVNMCHSPDLPPPPPATDAELEEAFRTDNSAAYRVPLSLSPPRSDMDKTGQVCVVFDVCVHSEPLDRALNSQSYGSFLIKLAAAWISEKYKLPLSEDYSLPKMRAKGTLVQHTVRKYRRPIIAEVGKQSAPAPSSSSLAKADAPKKAVSFGSAAPVTTSTSASATVPLTKKPSQSQPDSSPAQPRGKQTATPKYAIIQEPAKGWPEHIIVTISLPYAETTSGAELDIEADRLIFNDHGHYLLDLALPFSIDIDEAGAQFDRKTKVLSVTASVLPSKDAK